MIENAILQSIDNINDEIENSSFYVLESMVALYSKEIDFMDFCSPELKNEIIMEGSVMDNVKKAGKKDSNKLITILAFIPRLIIEMCKAIGKAFNDSSLGKKLKSVGDELGKLAGAPAKKAKVKEINEAEGREVVYYDEKSGKIKFKRSWNDAFAALAWFAGTFDIIFNLFKDIKAEFDVTNPSKIRTFVDECDKIIHRRKDHKFTEVVDMGIDALGDLIGHISGSAGALTAAGTAAATLVNRKLEVLRLNGEKEEDHQVLVALKELSNKLAIINGLIFAGTSILTVAKKMVGYGNLFAKHKEEKRELDLATRKALFDYISEHDPETINEVERKQGQNDMDYYRDIIQKYFTKRVEEDPHYAEASEKERRAAINAAIFTTFTQFEGKITKAAMDAYDAEVKKYYDEKKELHKQPTIFSRKKKTEEKKPEENKEPDDSK